jgi:uncharacterized protein (DUF2147 family)
MENKMSWKHALFVAVGLAAAAELQQPAFAADPSGLWRDQKGSIIKVHGCGTGMCIEVAKPFDAGAKDIHNPDPALRNRPIAGVTILSAAKGGDNVWKGRLYNAEDGQTYAGSMTLVSEAELKLEGCAMGVLCESRSWSRVR